MLFSPEISFVNFIKEKDTSYQEVPSVKVMKLVQKGT